MSEYLRFDLSDAAQALEAETRFGLRSLSDGKVNFLLVHPDAKPMACLLNFGGVQNSILIGPECVLNGAILAHGDNARVDILGHQPLLSLQINMYARATFTVAEGTVIYGMHAWISDDTTLEIGDGCLFSEGITMRTTDHHTLFDLASRKQLNWPSSIKIHPKVWLGQQVAIQKGAHVGEGAVVAGNAVVTKSIPPFELWGGVPARMIRKSVSWLHPHPATPEQIEARRRELGLI